MKKIFEAIKMQMDSALTSVHFDCACFVCLVFRLEIFLIFSRKLVHIDTLKLIGKNLIDIFIRSKHVILPQYVVINFYIL